MKVDSVTAVNAPTQYVETRGRTLAYRRFGDGPPLILFLRLRGVMDVWDPAFLDALATSFTVIIFDYTGLGSSTGTPTYNRTALAQDGKDLIDALGYDRVVVAGWSLGGIAAQHFTVMYPGMVSHAILIGTVPPGPQPHGPEPIFFPTAFKPVNDLEDEYILFFEPNSEKSRAAAKASRERIAARTVDISPPIPEATYLKLVQDSSDPSVIYADYDGTHAAFLSATDIPILAINGDHDVVFPVENWYALNRAWGSLHILTFPQSGHGPQHQHADMAADAIASFVRKAR